MGTGGWRRAFCTAVRRDPGATEAAGEKKQAGDHEKQQQQQRAGPSHALSCAKLSFFSGGRDGCSASPEIRCRTKSNGSKLRCSDALTPTVSTRTSTAAAAAAVATADKRSSSPVLFHRKASSAPSSLRSASEIGLFQHLSKSRCRICWQSLRVSQDVPVFTAECSHAFHFPCVIAHVRNHRNVACPICSAAWRQVPFLSAVQRQEDDTEQVIAGEADNRNPNRRTSDRSSRSTAGGREPVKIYDDDEPLLLAAPKLNQGGVRFNPIPEVTNEDDKECSGEKGLEREDEFHRLLSGTRRATPRSRAGGVHVTVMPQTALLSKGRRHWNYVVAIKVKAPALRPSKLLDQTQGRAPIDLVMVLDVSYGMTGEKLQMLKRAMRLVVSSLGSADRLSIVAFSASAGPKRLLPLRRMSRRGQRAARHIVERLVAMDPYGESASIGDALRKATKVLEDRRERNPVATIMLLSDAGRNLEESENNFTHSPRGPPVATNTRFAHLEIPVGFQKKQSGLPSEDAFIKCVGGLVSVVMRDVCLQLEFPSGEICAVYPSGGGGNDVSIGTGSSVLRLGDLYAEEERELLVELRMTVTGEQQIDRHCLSAKCKYRDPATHKLSFDEEQLVPLPSLRSDLRGAASIWLRNAFITTRAMAESKRLVEDSEFTTAHRLLSSARALVLQSASDAQDSHLVRLLDAELAEVQRRREVHVAHPKEEAICPADRHRHRHRHRRDPAEVREESLTPTSAWRAAEQLAKVAIVRKSLNRVSDLHGFENARF